MEVVTVLGTRPEFTKAFLVSKNLEERGITEYLIHTGQHYDKRLNSDIFSDVDLREPDINLKIGSGTHAEQTGKMLIKLGQVLGERKPKAVIAYGDTNSTLSGTLAATKLGIPVIHIEGGERNYDMRLPEEINRIICDHISRVNCCATKNALKNLKQEGLKNGIWTGDIMLDTFLLYIDKSKSPKQKLPESYILVTMHREENVDNDIRLKRILSEMGKMSIPIVWPMHPRAAKAIKLIKEILPSNIFIIPPVTYSEMLWLEKNCVAVITDSGGVQKEVYWLGKPCTTILSQTHWPQTLIGGWNVAVGDNLSAISKNVLRKPIGEPKAECFGDGNAVKKICDVVEETIGDKRK